jgi:hypothetical protein
MIEAESAWVIKSPKQNLSRDGRRIDWSPETVRMLRLHMDR